VHGSAGRAVLRYTTDQLEIDGQPTRIEPVRDDLLENLLEHRADPEVPLLAPLSAGRETAHSVTQLYEVANWVAQAADDLALFSELGAPWTRHRHARPLETEIDK
jgi:hypothetical protein